VRMLPCVFLYYNTCVLILLCMCPHTVVCATLMRRVTGAILLMCPHTSHHTATCVLILVCTCRHATRTACVWATFMRRVTGATRATTSSACGSCSKSTCQRTSLWPLVGCVHSVAPTYCLFKAASAAYVLKQALKS
jgi:hypothetical protein